VNPVRLLEAIAPQGPRYLQALLAWGALTVLGGAFLVPQRVWPMVLMASYGLICLGLAGGFFVALQYVTGSTWCIAIRRVPEAMTAALPAGALGLALLFLVRPHLYPWFGDQAHFTATEWFKAAWLSPAFFFARSVTYVLVWLLLIRRLVGASRQQDGTGDPALTAGNRRRSAVFIVVFTLTFWPACFDWIMSLEPHWYSTIFGVYNFAGLFLSGLAVMAILLVWLLERERGLPARNQRLRGVVTSQHLVDLGRLMGAFSTFWAYTWFSQYMLIWYANLPEETGYFIHRLKPDWAPLFVANLALNWTVPFLLLLPRATKQNPRALAGIALIVLLGRLLDLYLMVAPPFAGSSPVFGLWELGVLAGAGAVFALVFRLAIEQAQPVPVGDPQLQESLHYH